MIHLSAQQALKLAADFALTADQVRAAEGGKFTGLASLYERASRVAYLRARILSKDEELNPRLGECSSRAIFAIV